MKLKDYRDELRQDAEYLAAEAELRPLLDLADDVLALRLAQNWSQADLAERVGTRQANISRLESGLANPTLKFLQKLAVAFDAELTVHLQPKQGAHRREVQTAVTRPTDSSTEHLIAVPNWPRPPEPCGFVWDVHTSASTVQQEVSA
jgi:transcriptional regulator with XRE-family HTH domain